MQIFVQESELHTIECQPADTVGTLKRSLVSEFGVEPEEQVLAFGGTILDSDDATLQDIGVSNLSTLNLSVRLLGGKVHGSLARAGKVKGQTPKVAKQEKKKKKTGRAKRRMQYKRRFVNKVQTFGRRRGPNANTQPTN